MRIVKLPQALIDLVETADYLAKHDVKVADRFFDAFEATLGDIKRQPKIGAVKVYRDDLDIRMWFIRGFEKNLIFYTETSEEIVILGSFTPPATIRRSLRNEVHFRASPLPPSADSQRYSRVLVAPENVRHRRAALAANGTELRLRQRFCFRQVR